MPGSDGEHSRQGPEIIVVVSAIIGADMENGHSDSSAGRIYLILAELSRRHGRRALPKAVQNGIMNLYYEQIPQVSFWRPK